MSVIFGRKIIVVQLLNVDGSSWHCTLWLCLPLLHEFIHLQFTSSQHISSYCNFIPDFFGAWFLLVLHGYISEHLYSALYGIQTTLKRSGMDHTVLPAINPMTVVYLVSVHQMAPPRTDTYRYTEPEVCAINKMWSWWWVYGICGKEWVNWNVLFVTLVNGCSENGRCLTIILWFILFLQLCYQKFLEQEESHLSAMDKLVPSHRVRPSVLLPIWRVAGFVLGQFYLSYITTTCHKNTKPYLDCILHVVARVRKV